MNYTNAFFDKHTLYMNIVNVKNMLNRFSTLIIFSAQNFLGVIYVFSLSPSLSLSHTHILTLFLSFLLF